MGTKKRIDLAPDLMRRRTPLLFSKRFVWRSISVEICTDSTAILSAAEGAGFLPECCVERPPEMRWEIVSEMRVSLSSNWSCRVTVDNHSFFLSMGTGQWFAFDFGTGDGAGFVVVSDQEAHPSANVERYLREILHHIADPVHQEMERSELS